MDETKVEKIEPEVEEVIEKEPDNTVSIFKNLGQKGPNGKPKIVPTSFEDIERNNQELKKKLEDKRRKNNKNVIRSYRLK
jgi:hypothetical protein